MILPKHIAVIPDGNRRWAKRRGLSIEEGYRAGAEKAEKLFEWCIIKHDIPQLSVFALSTENLSKRVKEELRCLVDVYEEQFRRIAEDERIHSQRVKINVLGDLLPLPKRLRDAARYAMERTKGYKDHLINFFMPYGGRWEILRAVKKLLEDVTEGRVKSRKLNERKFSQYLFTKGASDPDLVIRTAERRMSNFLLWQTAYSEIFFVDKHWPDFELEDLEKILEEFSRRKRSFGR